MSYLTPSKKTSNLHPYTADTTSLSVSRFQASSIDFKAKTYELMDEIVELKKIKNQQLSMLQIVQQKLQKQKKLTNKIMQMLNCSSQQQIVQKIEALNNSCNQKSDNNLKVYRKQIDQLLRKVKELTINCQVYTMRDKSRYSDISPQLQKDTSDKQDNQLIKEQLELLKSQLGDLLSENTMLKEKNQELQKDLSRNIVKFEYLENLITEKVSEYTQEIEQYQKQIEKSQLLIQEMRKQNNEQEQFSFGQEQSDKKNKREEEKDVNQKNDILCYQASIDGLMDENKRLKKVLQALYRVKHGQSVSPETEREINIMERIIALNCEQHQ